MANFEIEVKESIAFSQDELLESIEDFLIEKADSVDLIIPKNFWSDKGYADTLDEIARLLHDKANDIRKIKKEEEETESLKITTKMLNVWRDFCNDTHCEDCPFYCIPEICDKVG